MVKKIMLTVLLVGIGLALFFIPKEVLATPEGYVNCSDVKYDCSSWYLRTCDQGCATWECGENCPAVPGPTPTPGGGGNECPAGQIVSCPDVPYLCQTYCTFPDGWVFVDGLRDECGHTSAGATKYYCRDCDCVPSCNATAPTILSITRGMPQTTATVSWTSGSNGTSEKLYIDSDKADIDRLDPCPNGIGTGSGKCTYVNSNASSPQNVTGLALNTTYYARVQNYKDATCSSNSPVERYLSSCTLSPSFINLSTNDDPIPLISGVKSSPEIQRVDFSSDFPDIASVNPSSDTSYVYQTTVSPKKKGKTDIKSTVYFNDIPTPVCTSKVAADITTPGPWWQVKDGAVSSGGNLRSILPSGEFFDLAGAGGYPGVPAYAGTAGFGNGQVSETSWLVDSPSSSSRVFDYQWFANQIPESITPKAITSSSIDASYFDAAAQNGYEWYKYSGPNDLNIDADVALGSSKVILLVENANLNINGKIRLADGSGFFMVIVKGNINVNPSVGVTGSTPDLEGIYLADGAFSTGTTGAGDSNLYIRGAVATYGGVSLLRDLGGSNSTPAETFEYAPDQILLFPPKLSTRRINWKEVAP